MPLTPKETGTGRPAVFPVTLEHSALIESAYSSTGAVAEDCTIALGWKPTKATKAPLNDMTAHYLLTIRKVGSTVTVWAQGTQLAAYGGSVGSTYAAFLQNVLTYYAGSYHGYYSRVVVVDGVGYDHSAFWEVSAVVSGLWVPKTVVLTEQASPVFVAATSGVLYTNFEIRPSVAFDGNTTQSHGECAVSHDSDTGAGTFTYYIGRHYATAMPIHKVTSYPSTNYGWTYAGTTMTLTLKGSTDGTTFDTLGSVSVTPSSTAMATIYSDDTTTAYAYVIVEFTFTLAAGYIGYAICAEMQVFTSRDVVLGPNGGVLNLADAAHPGYIDVT